MTIVMEPAGYLAQVGALVRGARQNRGLTQAQLEPMFARYLARYDVAREG